MIPALTGALAVALFALWKFHGYRVSRLRGLEEAVRERTKDLERERSREKARNRIMELLVTNQPLGLVLDEIARMVCAEISGAVCVIALHRGPPHKSQRCHIVSAFGASPAMVAALQTEYAIPFEVWRGSTEFRRPAEDPAWKNLLGRLEEPAPAAIRTRAVGGPDRNLGACLVFENSQTAPEPSSASLSGFDPIEHATRLAQLAIEHSRFCDELNYQAHHDSLTGLPNRVLFEDRLLQAVAEARNVNRRVAILYIDLDRFKQINDTMSHRVGDLFLAEIAARIARAVRPGDTVARIGGDEFNVLVTNIGDTAEIEALANRILEALREPALIEGRSIVGSASIGISVFPDDGADPEELQRQADAAMYCAKGLGRNRLQTFSARNDTLDSVRMDQELKRALRDRLFEVYYQPKVDARGRFAGMEALLRLNHPVHGQIPPNKFIPMAEESGLIVPLGAWVLDEVCRQIGAWSAQGMGRIAVAVNVSPLQICRPDFAADVEDCLRRRGISPHCLELELTESLLIGSGEETQKQMNRLRSLGIRFSIDDFGTGYSSLSYLHRLRVDAIKLDRSFVQCLGTDDAARRLVQAMIGVAEGLGLGVIAEGVETEEQREVLIAAGCPTMQGFLFSRPQPPARLEEYLRAAASAPDESLADRNAFTLAAEPSGMLTAV
jgi:diguanylate cyclase (GGDEF)-like protein